MKFANQINDLVVKFKRLDFDEQLNAEMLVIERLYPIDFRAYEIEKRELWIEVFEDELIKITSKRFCSSRFETPIGYWRAVF